MNILGVIYILSFYALFVCLWINEYFYSRKVFMKKECFFEILLCLIVFIDSLIFYFITNDFEYINGFILGIAILILLKMLDYIVCKFYKGKKK